MMKRRMLRNKYLLKRRAKEEALEATVLTEARLVQVQANEQRQAEEFDRNIDSSNA